jgi:hypothetical protein
MLAVPDGGAKDPFGLGAAEARHAARPQFLGIRQTR